jgi:hypothetical protein
LWTHNREKKRKRKRRKDNVRERRGKGIIDVKRKVWMK